MITKVGDFSSYTVEGVAETRTHGNAHELTNIAGGGNPGALAYDAKGNLTTRSDNFSFVWDFDNQLKEVTVPVGATLGNVGTHKYSYDALGRRVLKHVAGEKRLIFVHDGDQIIAEYKYTNGVIGVPGGIDASTSTTSQSTQTQDSAVIIGTRRGTATIQRKYMYTSYIDERCLMVDRTALGASPAGTEELFYYHSNNLYSTGAMTDALGAVTERYAYDAYGQIVFLNAAGAPLATQASTIGQPYTYTGRRLDDETENYHYRSRYYDAFIIQRFLGRDRIEYGDGYNMYGYVGGGPLTFVDPTGHEKVEYDENGSVWVYPESIFGGWDYDSLRIWAGDLVEYESPGGARALLIETPQVRVDVHGKRQTIYLHYEHFSKYVESFKITSITRDYVQQYADREGFSFNRSQKQINRASGIEAQQLVHFVNSYGFFATFRGLENFAREEVICAALTGGAGAVVGKLRYLKHANKAKGAGTALGGPKWASWDLMPKVNRGGRVYANIDGRLYTQHAIERMSPRALGNAPGGIAGRGVPPSVVENVIQHGSLGSIGVSGSTTRVSKTLGNVEVILEQGIVVTVIRH